MKASIFPENVVLLEMSRGIVTVVNLNLLFSSNPLGINALEPAFKVRVPFAKFNVCCGTTAAIPSGR